MKIKFLLALIVAGVMSFSGPALAHDTPPLHYHVGESQPFQGLLCRTQSSAMHIFETWMERDVNSAQQVYNIYAKMGECRFSNGYHGYFIEEIASSIATNLDGEEDTVVVFAVSPEEGSETVDYLVTWVNLGQSVQR